MTKPKVNATIQNYFKTTTLHGFKYLCSIHCVDRIGWLVCCCASAVCGGVLCAVLWARFLEVPALLALGDDVRSDSYRHERMPGIAICVPPESVALMFLNNLTINSSDTERIPKTFARLLTGNPTADDQLFLLDEILKSNNVSLLQVMLELTPGCDAYTRRCRYQKKMLPCDQLFDKELTVWGLCCVMRPEKLLNVPIGQLGQTHTTQMLDLVLQCAEGSKLFGCQLVTYYEGEEWLKPSLLAPGYYYIAQLRFTAIPSNSDSGSLVETACVHDPTYSRPLCMRKCVEESCGCRDPFKLNLYSTDSDLPVCPISKMPCVRAKTFKSYENISCYCLPSCNKITTFMVLESSPITLIKQTIDPIFFGLNVTPSIVLNLRVNVAHSRVFLLNPTETWLTLLSSLGGVFNMFLGVGLFSALEFLYLLIVQLPVAIKRSSEIDPTTSVTPGPLR